MTARGTVKGDAVRAEVRNLVHGPSYMTFDDVVADFPMKHINTRPPNVPYTPWHLLEHMRIAQRDILEYIEDPEYRLPTWPDDYWPKPDATADAKAWRKTVAAFRRDRAALEKIAAEPPRGPRRSTALRAAAHPDPRAADRLRAQHVSHRRVRDPAPGHGRLARAPLTRPADQASRAPAA